MPATYRRGTTQGTSPGAQPLNVAGVPLYVSYDYDKEWHSLFGGI